MQIIEEVRIQKMLVTSANIIRIFKVFENQSTLYILMEYKEGGNLKEAMLKRMKFSEQDAKIICA